MWRRFLEVPEPQQPFPPPQSHADVPLPGHPGLIGARAFRRERDMLLMREGET